MSDIYKAMLNVMAQVRAIPKDKVNQQQRFNFRGIDDVYNFIQPLLAESGIFSTSEILDHQRQKITTRNGVQMEHVMLTMRYTYHAADGSSVFTEVVGEGQDMSDKASNKAMAIADKYALLQAFKIPTLELQHDDPDATTPPMQTPTPEAPAKKVKLLSPAQIKRFATMCGSLDVDRDALKKKAKVSSMKEIPAAWADKMETWVLQQGTPALLAAIEAAKSIDEMEKLDDSLSWYKKEDFADLHEKATAKITALTEAE